MPSSQPIYGGQPPQQPTPTPATVVDPDFDPATLGPPPGVEGEGRAAARAAGFPDKITGIVAEDGTPLVAWLDDGPVVPMAMPNDPAPGPVVTATQTSVPAPDPTGKTDPDAEALSLAVDDEVEVVKPRPEPQTNGAVLDPVDDLPDDEPADA